MLLDQHKLELAGRAAYEAYRAERRVAVNGDALPPWAVLEEPIRVAWRMAADAAVMIATGPTEPLPTRWQPVSERFPNVNRPPSVARVGTEGQPEGDQADNGGDQPQA